MPILLRSGAGLPDLAHEWAADPEAMPDERRAALLDAVRERVDKWIEGYPERRAAEVHTWFCKEAAPRFGGSAVRRLRPRDAGAVR